MPRRHHPEWVSSPTRSGTTLSTSLRTSRSDTERSAEWHEESKRIGWPRRVPGFRGVGGARYLSERQWGTVREDYSENGDTWSYFTHNQARSRAYKWGEDGIAGLCDDRQLLCFVFARTWGERAGPKPDQEYWTEVLGAVRAVHPDLLFAAEAYWDMEWDLQQLGFDHCYDKRLYDRLVHEGPGEVRGHLDADLDYQAHLLRFIENHDEPRAAATFTPAGGAGRRGDGGDAARRHPVARRPVRGLEGAATGLPRSPAGRTGRRGPASVPPPTRRRRCPGATGPMAAVSRRAAGPRTEPRPARRLVLDGRRQPARSSSSTSPTRRPPPTSISPGPTSEAEPGASRTCFPETSSNPTVTRPPLPVSTSTFHPGGRTSWTGRLVPDGAVHQWRRPHRRLRPASLARGRSAPR